MHRCLHAICHLIEDHAAAAGLPLRFAASKIVEGDALILSQLSLDQNERETIEHIVLQMEKERGLDRSAAIADMRFAFIRRVCAGTVKKPHESKERLRSERLDRVLTGKYTAIPVFIGIMALVFYLTFNVIGAWLQELLESGVDALGEWADGALAAAHVNPALHSLIVKGIFAGVGSVLSFLPIIVTLFFFLSILEDSGYIARVAFFMDKLLRRIGLSGAKNVAQLLWEKAKDFLQRAFSVILIATLVVWFLQSFDLHFNMVADSQDSILAMATGIVIWQCVLAWFAALIARAALILLGVV